MQPNAAIQQGRHCQPGDARAQKHGDENETGVQRTQDGQFASRGAENDEDAAPTDTVSECELPEQRVATKPRHERHGVSGRTRADGQRSMRRSFSTRWC